MDLGRCKGAVQVWPVLSHHTPEGGDDGAHPALGPFSWPAPTPPPRRAQGSKQILSRFLSVN